MQPLLQTVSQNTGTVYTVTTEDGNYVLLTQKPDSETIAWKAIIGRQDNIKQISLLCSNKLSAVTKVASNVTESSAAVEIRRYYEDPELSSAGMLIHTSHTHFSFECKQDAEGNIYMLYVDHTDTARLTKIVQRREGNEDKLFSQWVRTLPPITIANEKRTAMLPNLVVDNNNNCLLVYKEQPSEGEFTVQQVSVHVQCVSGLGHVLWSFNTNS